MAIAKAENGPKIGAKTLARMTKATRVYLYPRKTAQTWGRQFFAVPEQSFHIPRNRLLCTGTALLETRTETQLYSENRTVGTDF